MVIPRVVPLGVVSSPSDTEIKQALIESDQQPEVVEPDEDAVPPSDALEETAEDEPKIRIVKP